MEAVAQRELDRRAALSRQIHALRGELAKLRSETSDAAALKRFKLRSKIARLQRDLEQGKLFPT